MKYINNLLQNLTPTGAILGFTVVSSLGIAQSATAFTLGFERAIEHIDYFS